jgi:hypothetical protein
MNSSGAIAGPLSDSSLDSAQSEFTQRQCQWENCSSLFRRAGLLHSHLCKDHIGKMTNSNKCLTCKWKDCGRFFAERDQIIDHCRTIHVSRSTLQPEPHVCEVWGRLRQHRPKVNTVYIHLHSYRCVIESSNKSLISRCTSRTSTNRI